MAQSFGILTTFIQQAKKESTWPWYLSGGELGLSPETDRRSQGVASARARSEGEAQRGSTNLKSDYGTYI